MSWVIVGTTVAGAAMGKMKNDRAKQVEDAERKLAAAKDSTSWVTGVHGGPVTRAGSGVLDMGQGALSGAMFGQQFSKGFGKPSAPTDPNLGVEANTGLSSSDGGSFWEQMQEQDRQKGMMGAAGKMYT